MEKKYKYKTNKPLAKMLRKARVDAGLTYRKAGEKIGISYVYIGELENGKKTPSEKMLKILSRFYSIPLIELKRNANKQRLINYKERNINIDNERINAAIAILDIEEEKFRKIKDIIGER